MANGNEMLDDTEFENRLQTLTGDDLSRFIAHQLYEHRKEDKLVAQRVIDLEARGKKFAGTVGGLSGALGGAIIAGIDYLMKK